MDTGAESAIKQVELHRESGDENLKVPVPVWACYDISADIVNLIYNLLPFTFDFGVHKGFEWSWPLTVQEVQALESEIALLRNLRHEVCL